MSLVWTWINNLPKVFLMNEHWQFASWSHSLPWFWKSSWPLDSLIHFSLSCWVPALQAAGVQNTGNQWNTQVVTFIECLPHTPIPCPLALSTPKDQCYNIVILNVCRSHLIHYIWLWHLFVVLLPLLSAVFPTNPLEFMVSGNITQILHWTPEALTSISATTCGRMACVGITLTTEIFKHKVLYGAFHLGKNGMLKGLVWVWLSQ